jgi:hypothetical protein
MSRIVGTCAAGVLLCVTAAPLAAQTAATPIRDQRYQVGVMESVLEQAVQHGADKTRERVQAVLPPAELMFSTSARVRGFRQDGYGVFFDVEVPTLDTSLPWSYTVLDQNGLGLDSALQAFRAAAQKSGDTNLEQALKRIELQLAPVSTAQGPPQQGPSPLRTVSGSAAVAPLDTRPSPVSPIANVEAYLVGVRDALRSEVRNALIDAMLEHSRGLEIAPNEWLHIAARRSEDRLRLAPVDINVDTMHIRVRGADLTEFLGGKISREEAVRRVEVKVN